MLLLCIWISVTSQWFSQSLYAIFFVMPMSSRITPTNKEHVRKTFLSWGALQHSYHCWLYLTSYHQFPLLISFAQNSMSSFFFVFHWLDFCFRHHLVTILILHTTQGGLRVRHPSIIRDTYSPHCQVFERSIERIFEGGDRKGGDNRVEKAILISNIFLAGFFFFFFCFLQKDNLLCFWNNWLT